LLATVIGAYIVNHYISNKPDAPVAAVLSTAEPKADAKAPDAAKAEAKTDAKTPETSSDVANIPEPGVRAKGISEKAVLDKATATVEKSADKPTETASIPPDTRRHQAAPREKTVAKTVPAPQPSVPAVVPVVAAAPNPVPPAAAPATPVEEHRDANDLARAAIERLRGLTADTSPRAPEVARAPDAARIPDAPHVVYAAPIESPRAVPAPAVRPLPPPIMVSTPAREPFDPAAGSPQGRPPYDAARNDDPHRPTPPADIPVSQPLDLRAEAIEPLPKERRNVAEDVLSAAKSVFHAVLPK
ncbi:MAG TPA: hypothetical protein VIH62_02450, partial [Xanthobacteraceae bacterium]